MIIGGAKALWEHKITVNGYGPGVVKTSFGSSSTRISLRSACSRKRASRWTIFANTMILMKKLSTPDDVKGTAAFLCSSESDYMTGQLIMIDGGMIMQ